MAVNGMTDLSPLAASWSKEQVVRYAHRLGEGRALKTTVVRVLPAALQKARCAASQAVCCAASLGAAGAAKGGGTRAHAHVHERGRENV